MKIPHVTYKQYIAGVNRDEVDYVLKYNQFQPEDLFEIGDIMKRSFDFVKNLQSMFNGGMTWDDYFSFIDSQGFIDKDKLYDTSIYVVYASMLWFKERVEFINELESSSLGHTPTGEEIQAGIENFSIFDNYPQYRNLAGGGDYDKIERVKQWPYEYCFLEMKYVATKQEFESELMKIRTKKK